MISISLLSRYSSYLYRHFGNNDQDDFRVVSGILRLSTKYLIDSLRDRAIAHLSTAWPSTIRGWDAREDLARAYEMETGASGARLYPSPLVSLRLCPYMILANNQNSRLSLILHGKSMRLPSFHPPSSTSLGIPILKYSTPVLKILCITRLIIRRSHRNPLRPHSHPPFIFLSAILNVFV